MIRRVFIILCFFICSTCDDGDILTVELDFDQELERCDNFEDTYLLYDTKEDPDESLILIIEKNDANELLFTEPTADGSPAELPINETTTRFIYRTYNRAIDGDELCNVVSASDLIITDDNEASIGTVEVTATIEDDDNDGVPTEFEGRGELDENGEYSNALDTDGDEIPDYLDEDDDNDNVKTINEIDNSDGDNDPTTNPQNTDLDLPNGDDIPDYLDADDDGDGVLTRFEDEDLDMNPIDDTATNDGVTIAHYLNNLEATDYGDPGLSDTNEYTRTVTTSFLVRNIDLEILRTTEIDFGILTTIISNYQPAN